MWGLSPTLPIVAPLNSKRIYNTCDLNFACYIWSHLRYIQNSIIYKIIFFIDLHFVVLWPTVFVMCKWGRSG